LSIHRVLVIEDDANISRFIADLLKGVGFDVETAENGAVGMTKLRAKAPDLITLDLMMPVMDGWEFLRQCRTVPGYARSPILVMSAARRPELGSFGACEFLAKPFDLDDLLATVYRLAVQRPAETESLTA
jgi:two-component system, chemotaxis family, chemotaxis protein CheY